DLQGDPVAVVDGREILQVVIAALGIIPEPLQYLQVPRRVDVHDVFVPRHHEAPTDRLTEGRAKPLDGGVRWQAARGLASLPVRPGRGRRTAIETLQTPLERVVAHLLLRPTATHARGPVRPAIGRL